MSVIRFISKLRKNVFGKRKYIDIILFFFRIFLNDIGRYPRLATYLAIELKFQYHAREMIILGNYGVCETAGSLKKYMQKCPSRLICGITGHNAESQSPNFRSSCGFCTSVLRLTQTLRQ